MGKLLQHGPELKVVLDTLVFAKQMGMIDHREARDLWGIALKEAEIEIPRSDGVRQGRAN